MTVDDLLKELKKCYSNKQQAFYADIPSHLGKEILNKLSELKKLKKGR